MGSFLVPCAPSPSPRTQKDNCPKYLNSVRGLGRAVCAVWDVSHDITFSKNPKTEAYNVVYNFNDKYILFRLIDKKICLEFSGFSDPTKHI